ncbi:MerR family transcriptional regulator [Aliidiomarina sedimenti]|uniref:MerR family transcriptional regulator n=1 Tax=Aliidiomarina sedimenti TaxID=1933879 RepID=A0ABY0C3K6_9GAMM|nr:MerR family DNA-binding transcriptional regulator [Aliidiomarina sedimenti]RUO32073.1 MerR family transcriptional regulator [Aliidiomarina sedimenti]
MSITNKTTTPARTFSIGELAREFDITTRSIRFYEDQGLLAPSRQGQTRIYGVKDKVRLKLILRGKRLGFTLAETRRLFELYDRDQSSENQLATMLELIDDKKLTLQQQLEDINVLLHELKTVEQRCRAELNSMQGSIQNKDDSDQVA